jgi:hypothetical protein
MTSFSPSVPRLYASFDRATSDKTANWSLREDRSSLKSNLLPLTDYSSASISVTTRQPAISPHALQITGRRDETRLMIAELWKIKLRLKTRLLESTRDTRDVCLITPTPMSNILPPLAIPTGDRRNSKSSANVSLPPLSSWSYGYRAFDSLESSPPRSSSPPMTPFSTRSSQSYAFIQSSPRIAYEIGHHAPSDHVDDHPSAWDRNYMHYPTTQTTLIPHTLPSIKSLYASDAMMRAASPFHASRSSEKMRMGFREQQVDVTSDVASRYASTFYDSEEEEHEDEDDESSGFSFVEEDARATFFRTSAERGQWKNDPIALKMQSFLQMRQSAPTWSPPPLSGLQLVSRPISEPAHSTSRASSPADVPDSHDEDQNAFELPLTPSVDTAPSDHLSPAECDPPSSLPSLTSDKETSQEPEEMDYSSSPLPPSSPPLSPISAPASPMMRSMSPLSFASSPPFLAPSSPLSFASSDHDYEDMDLESDGYGDDVAPETLSEPFPSMPEPSPVVCC